MSDDHDWCRDVRRDEAVRAAEDAAAVPAIQHRDLPEIVADLRERVARVEAAVTPKSVSLSNAEGLRTERVTLEVAHRKHAAHEWAWPQMIWLDAIRGESVRVVDDAAEITRLTAERDEAIRERDAAKEECERLGQIVSKYQETRQWDIEKIEDGCVRVCFGDHHRAADCEWEYFIPASREANLQNQRSGAIRERDEANKECERLRAKIVAMEGQSRMETEAEIAVEEAWERCGIAPYWPDDEPGTSHRYAKSMEAEIVRLRACVAELEAGRDAAKEECERLRHLLKTKESECETHHPWVHPAAAPAANAGGEKQEPVAWGVLMTPGSKVWRCSSEKQAQKCVDHFGTGTVVPLYAAPQPPRGWLTAEERALIEYLRATFEQNADAWRPHGLGGHVDNQERRVRLLDALLARETPPRVKVPHFDDLEADERPVWQSACEAWIAAIRDAGVEVADE